MPTAPPRHVLFVISDQHLATCTGYEGHPQALTPNLDRLAREGVRFPHAYTQNPICTPSRVSLFSGQYCHNHGYYGLSGPRPERLPGFLGHFRAHGYRTAGIGKLHLPNHPSDWLLDQVDHYAECYGYGQPRSAYFDYLERLGLRELEDSIRLPELPGAQQDEGRPSRLPYEHCVEGWCVQQAVQFMDQARAAGQPFCMQISLPRPHQCYTPDQRFWDLYPDDLALPPTLHQDPAQRPPHFRATVERARHYEGLLEPKGVEQVRRRVWRAYLACITQVDYALGQLLDYLDRHGLAEDTIVIYGSDHGAYSGTHGIPEKAPGICSEAVCRVPFLWRVPGVTRPGHVARQLVENVDLAPTITALCGLPAMSTVDGHDLTALLRGGDQPLRQVAVTEHPWSKAIRWGDWRLVHYQRAMFGGDDVGELYHLGEDPHELRNRYADPACREIVAEGRRLLLEWLIATTRVVTAWPAVNWQQHPYDYATAGDGKAARGAGPERLAAHRQLHYL